MCPHVCLEVTIFCAFVVALLADERLLSTMHQHVTFEVTSCCAGELTLFATERLLS